MKQLKEYLVALAIAVLVLSTAGCASSLERPGAELAEAAPTGTTITLASAAPAGRAAPVAAAAAVDAGTAGASAADVSGYRIAPKDVLEVTVFRVPDLSATVTVDLSGYVQLPLTGQVLAGGRTVAELRSVVIGQLSRYLQSPDVRIIVKDAASQRVTIQGAVMKPGVYPLDGSTTLFQMIAMAGGLQRTAQSRSIVLFRTVNGERQSYTFDFGAVRGGSVSDPVLAAGDIIVVDESPVRSALRDLRESLGLYGMIAPLVIP